MLVIAYVVRLRSSSFSRHLSPSSLPRSPPAFYILSYLVIPVPALSTAEASLLNMRRRPIVAGPSDSLADLCTYLEARFLNRVWVPRNFSYTRSYLSLPHSLFDPPFEPPHSSLCSVSLDINRKGRTRPYLGLECLAHFLTHKLPRRAPLRSYRSAATPNTGVVLSLLIFRSNHLDFATLALRVLSLAIRGRKFSPTTRGPQGTKPTHAHSGFASKRFYHLSQ